jgi:hexokinase
VAPLRPPPRSRQVALRYREPHTALGIILGTGTNCAYLEQVAAIGKLPAGFRPRTPSMVVNTEWADLASTHLPSCTEDLWVDCSSTHPGEGCVCVWWVGGDGCKG